MNRKDIYTYLALAGIVALSTVTSYYANLQQKKAALTFAPTYTQKEKQIASEKTAALKALFESEGFKKGTSHDQRRLIEAIDTLYT